MTCAHVLRRYGGSRSFKMPSAGDSDAESKHHTRQRGGNQEKHRASPFGRPVALNRSELESMNRLIAKKMRGDLELALEIADENSLRNVDAAASRCVWRGGREEGRGGGRVAAAARGCQSRGNAAHAGAE